MKRDEASPSGVGDYESSTSRLGGDAVPRPRHEPLIWVFAAAALGVAVDRYGPTTTILAASRTADGSLALVMWWVASATCLAAWFISWRANRRLEPVCLILLSVAFLAGAWHHLNWHAFGEREIARFAEYEPQPACVDVIARQSPERVVAPRATPLRAIPGTERSRLMVELQGIRDGRDWLPASGICQLAVDGHLLGIHPGDRLRVYGQLARATPPLNPGEFDFAAHARADGQLARIRSGAPESIVRLASGSFAAPSYLLDRVRIRANALVRTLVGPQRAGLAAAILLGAREGLPYQETEPYLETGTVHVLVVSGMNVAILAFGLFMLMQIGWLPRRVALLVIVAIVIAYALLAEAQPPVVRSAVVGVLFCGAAWMGRRGAAFNSLFGAALVVLAINPSDLFRAGPQLSFLAVAALIWMSGWSARQNRKPTDPLEALLAEKRPWHIKTRDWALRNLWKGVVLSLAVWLVTLPLVLSQFHIVSPIAILVSPLVSLIVFFTMWSGFLMLAFGAVFPMIGAAPGAFCSTTIGCLETFVHWADLLPGGHFWAPGPAWWWVIVFYIALLTVMVRRELTISLRWQIAALAVWILIGLTPPMLRHWMRSELACSFISVGHGACVLVETPDGKTFMYDAGAIGSPEYATQTIASYLWHRGIMRIDALLISHADIDHYNAVPCCTSWVRI